MVQEADLDEVTARLDEEFLVAGMCQRSLADCLSSEEGLVWQRRVFDRQPDRRGLGEPGLAIPGQTSPVRGPQKLGELVKEGANEGEDRAGSGSHRLHERRWLGSQSVAEHPP